MQYRWLNDRQPDENGEITAVIETTDGKPISVFKGKDDAELVDRVLTGYTLANDQISKLHKRLHPDKGRKTLKAQSKVLTPDDKFRLASEINDPEKVVNAVQEIVNSTVKIPLEEIATKTLEEDEKQSEAFIRAEAVAFRDDVPEYMPSDKNFAALTDELKANGWDFTRNNLSIAYNTLKERGDLEPWPVEGAMPPTPESNSPPEEEEPATAAPNGKPAAAAAPEAKPPSPRPRSIATGLRNSDASALPPPPSRRKQYTRAEIELMSRTEFTRKLQEEPGFRQQVDAMGS